MTSAHGGLLTGLPVITTGVTGSPMFVLNNTGSQGGGVAAVNSTRPP